MQFTNKADIENYFNYDKIQCLICKKWFKTLSTHINKCHGVNVDQYKELFGLPWGRGLCGLITAQKMRDKAEILRGEGKLLTGIISKEHGNKVHKKGPRRQTPIHRKDRGAFCATLGKRNKYSTLDFNECWRLFKNGLTQKEIGERFGVAQMTISRFMRKANKNQAVGKIAKPANLATPS